MHRGRPLSEVVRLFVKYSNNSIAESLVKTIGARASGGPGSWAAGIAEMKRRLDSMGLPVEGLEIVDGSGLSPANRVTCRTRPRPRRTGTVLKTWTTC